MLKKQLFPDKEENKAVTHSNEKTKSEVRKEKEGQTALLFWALSRLYNASDGIYFPCLQITRVYVLLLPISFYFHECT